MGKPPTLKCRQCGKSTLKQDAIEYKPKFYFCCEQCKQDYINAHTVKPKTGNAPADESTISR